MRNYTTTERLFESIWAKIKSEVKHSLSQMNSSCSAHDSILHHEHVDIPHLLCKKLMFNMSDNRKEQQCAKQSFNLVLLILCTNVIHLHHHLRELINGHCFCDVLSCISTLTQEASIQLTKVEVIFHAVAQPKKAKDDVPDCYPQHKSQPYLLKAFQQQVEDPRAADGFFPMYLC